VKAGLADHDLAGDNDVDGNENGLAAGDAKEDGQWQVKQCCYH